MRRGNRTEPLFILLALVVPLLLFLGCSMPGRAYMVPQEERDIFDSDTDLVSKKVLKPENPILDFLKKRGLDLMDTFSLRISAGPGIRAHARITKILQAGIGYMGPADGRTMGHTFPVYKLGFMKREGGLWKERTAEIGISLFYYYQTEGEYMGGNKTHWGPEDRGFWDIGIAAHWLLIGGEAEIRPDEIIDFVGGLLFGADPMDDDGQPPDPDILRPVTG
jgi:hypothetical protein